MKKYFSIFIFFIFQACVVIQINESGYRSLDYLEKQHIKPFELAKSEDTCNKLDYLALYEINSKDIKDQLGKQEYTWIHIWNPYCSNESCINIDQFEKLEDSFKNKGLKLFFVSATYDFNHILSIAKNSNFSKNIYVLEGNYYGSKLKEIRHKLYHDLNTHSKPEDNFYHDDFLFHRDSLVFVGGEINDSILNSF